MNIIEIIEKKRDKKDLTNEELTFFINGYVADEIKDYQISALLMAIVLNNMTIKETTNLTNAMMHSGDIIDLSAIKGVKCDKHSTGGVGDKVSLVLAPLLASAGVKISKMSGRGLGHTGGTLDKLEAIPNFNVFLDDEAFIKQVNEIGISIIGQTNNLVPADKKLYALRDVTGTVQSIPLIASSIMSKKLASGSDAILLDVKVGSGAFMKTIDQANELAKVMVEIGKELSKDVKAVITDMDQPLGYAIGNSLEVIEAIATLKNEGPKDLTQICLKLGSIMLIQANIVDDENEAYKLLKSKLEDKSAFNKFREFVVAQGGDVSYIDDPNKFLKAKNIVEIKANKAGYITKVNALTIGKIALELGAGRHTKEDNIDYSAGILFTKKINDYLKENETIAYLHSNKDITSIMIDDFKNAIEVNNYLLKNNDLIKKIVK